MTEKQNDGGLPAAVVQSVTRIHGLDDFEDRAKDAGRKLDRRQLERRIGELLTGLGPPDGDDEQRRKFREFLCRVLTEPLDAIGVIVPPAGSDEYRLLVAFRGERFSPYFIRDAIIQTGIDAALLRRLNECEIQYLPNIEEAPI